MPGTPGVPTVSPDYKSLIVTWKAVTWAEQYEVYYGIGTPSTLATTTSGTTVSITGLTVGTPYYVRLRAKNINGVSEYGPSSSGIPNDIRSPGLYRSNEKIGNQNLVSALSWISTNVINDDEYYIVLGANESISPTSLDYSGKTVGITLLGYNSEKKVSLNTNGSLFTVNSGVTLTLDENVTLVGRSTNNASLVYTEKNSTLIMNDRAKIIGNTNNSRNSLPYISVYGGGVYNNGIFNMNGGEISSNIVSSTTGSHSYGGGVYNCGNFTMMGGNISGNIVSSSMYTANAGGGGVFNSGTFTMMGGNISGNSVFYDGTASYVYAYGGGVYNNGGRFIKTGESIITGYNATTEPNGNIVKINNYIYESYGYAVCVSRILRRNRTAGPGVNLDSSISGAEGGWDF
jgi:hypothetical protein